MLIIGAWLGRQIEAGVINRTAAVTALYMDSLVAPHLQDLSHRGDLDVGRQVALDKLLTDTPLGQKVVSFKIWGPDGRILYSSNRELVGEKFNLKPRLASAFAGNVLAEVSSLSDPEHAFERAQWPRLVEIYAPVRVEGTGTIIAVSEFYQTTDDLDQEIGAARQRSWLVVGLATLAMYGLLAGLVGRAGNTITAQQHELHDKVAQLTVLLEQNEQLHNRVRGAAARTTSLNERFLRRVSADVHDGPCQDLALALLRFEELAEMCHRCPLTDASGRSVREDFDTVHAALGSALADLRSISAGLRLPEIDQLSVAATAQRAVRDYERRTERQVTLSIGDDVPVSAQLPLKITLYRLLQESLLNGYHHSGGTKQSVNLASVDGVLTIQISDNGKGFDPQSVLVSDRLGIAGMQERIEVLGGTFDLNSAPGKGAMIRARLPLTIPEIGNE